MLLLMTMLLLAGFLALMLNWNSDVHLKLTSTGLNRALEDLSNRGKLSRLGVSQSGMSAMLSWLGLYNTSEDVEWCNVNDLVDGFITSRGGSQNSQTIAAAIQRLAASNHFADGCAVAIGGDQITHFMQSAFRPGAVTAWNRSIGQINEYFSQALQHFNEAFPSENSMFRSVEGMWLEAKNINLFDEVVGGALQQTIIDDPNKTHVTDAAVVGAWVLDKKYHDERSNKFRMGQHLLGRGLHTLQDAFSPAHCLRNASGMMLLDIYLYDKDNLDPGPIGPPSGGGDKAAACPGEYGWPGHHAFDRSDNNTKLQSLAMDATIDVITCIFENVHRDSGVASKEMNNKLWKWLAHNLPPDGGKK